MLYVCLAIGESSFMHVLAETAQSALPRSDVPKLGLFNFINCMPIVLPLLRKKVQIEAELVYGTPAELNKLLQNNSLQIAAVSSYFYLRQKELELVPQLSISSTGPIGSVLFFSKQLPDEKHCLRIVVPNSSATSINLLRIMLKEEYGVDADMVQADLPEISKPEYDGALVIGDYALQVDSSWSGSYRRWDLGQWWNVRFQLPMVFGVWAADKEWSKNASDSFLAICQSLQNATKIGLTSMFNEIVEETQKRTGLEESRIQFYFQKELDFSFKEDHYKGLELYRTLCERHGLFEL
jgi:chorismate dehydratase